MQEIEWRDIPGYEGTYSVSSSGDVRRDAGRTSAKDGKLLIGDVNKGYRRVRLSKDGVERRFFVHQLVLRAFIGPPQATQVANHKNSVRDDNRLDNLEWVTPRENLEHARINGRWHYVRPAHPYRGPRPWLARGERVKGSKLTTDLVRVIRSEAGSSTITALAAKYGVTRRAITQIIERRTWTHVD